MAEHLETTTQNNSAAGRKPAAARPAAAMRPPTRELRTQLEAAACSRPILAAAELLQDRIDEAQGPSGSTRRAEYRAVDALVFSCAVHLHGCGTRAAADLLGSRKLWAQLRKAQRKAHPGLDRRLSLSKAPPTIWQYRRFRDRCIDDSAADLIERLLQEHALEAARHCGILDRRPEGETAPPSRLCPSLIIAGDCTRIPAPQDADDRQHGPAGGEAGRPASRSTGDEGLRGHEVVFATAASGHPGERIIVAAERLGPGRRATQWLAEKIAGLRRGHPELADGIAGAVCDMEMGAEERDLLRSAGVAPISPARRKGEGRPAETSLGPHPFKRGAETAETLEVFAVDGTPTIKVAAPDGGEHAVPLTLVSHQKKRAETATFVYSAYAVPDTPEVPPRLAGLTVRIRHNSAPEEVEAEHPGTRELRRYPQGDRQEFARLYKAREQVESATREFKRRNAGRASAKTSVLRLDLLVAQALSIVSALIAHRRRTAADTAEWFGDHDPTAADPPRSTRRPRPPQS